MGTPADQSPGHGAGGDGGGGAAAVALNLQRLAAAAPRSLAPIVCRWGMKNMLCDWSVWLVPWLFGSEAA